MGVTNKTIKEFIKDFWPSIIVFGVILYATLTSRPLPDDTLPIIPYLDKLIHAIMMGGFVGAIAFDMQRKHREGRILKPKLMWTIVICVSVFGTIIEFVQYAMENGRGCEFADFMADIIGAIAARYLAPPAIYACLKIKRQ